MLDKHSLGIILLEVLVGSDVVLSCSHWLAAANLVKECRPHMDEETNDLLWELIHNNNDRTL